MKNHCPSCQSDLLKTVFTHSGIPTNSCLLFDSAQEARQVSRGDFALHVCCRCGLYFNAAFDEALCRYNGHYEETQSYSPTFRRYMESITKDLIQRHDLRHKKVLEIGCGKGEFLASLCERGENWGTGYDPSFRQDRHPSPHAERLDFRAEYFTTGSKREPWDLIINRMTLEHVPDIAGFFAMVKATMQDHPAALCYTQVPNSIQLITQGLVCDMLYEHCNYFTQSALSSALQQAGFAPGQTQISFGNQHLAIEARVGQIAACNAADSSEQIEAQAAQFSQRLSRHIERWNHRLETFRKQQQRVIIWGSGSKATAFLDYHHWQEELIAVVDINPNRHASYMAGSGHPIIAPQQLIGDSPYASPDVVIIMNPNYRTEIQEMLLQLGLMPTLLTLT
uniref:C-methyltransferase domain-containing protein n=1 Tax=Magnetococcus massalia (strain MO-1) TaxID=451514 RepID=A0A1S7LMX1_MAGMO|nr:Protein of unknown function. Containing C-methyltransferase domain [Candidatus Magnetococcus massalia]